MNRDDIIRMAREAGWTDYSLLHSVEVRRLEQFANLVAAAEREACAGVLDEVLEHLYIYGYDGDAYGELRRCAAAIRARGEK